MLIIILDHILSHFLLDPLLLHLIRITIIDDNVLEDNEMFNISITSITNGHIVDTPAVATVTIIDTTSK